MAIHVAIEHQTDYVFDRRVTIAPHIIRLRPAPHCRTPVLAYSLQVEPGNHFINWQQDPFGNYLARLVFPDKAEKLSVSVSLIADMTVINPFDFFLEDSASHFPVSYTDTERRELQPYLELSEHGPLLQAYLQQVPKQAQPIIDFLVTVNQQLQQDIAYLIRLEPGIQPCDETLEKRCGSCRDTAWLLVQLLRHLGLAARFVSGYLVQLSADVKALDGPAGPAADFTDLHAWAEVYLPGAGWVGLDPTSGLFAGEGHIPLACTPSPVSAAAITGATEPCEVSFSFSNQVRRIHEDPRVTKPFSEKQWQSILALGEQVDKQLVAEDVRLTMGGEPTFVSMDDMDSPEWNTTALGEHKRKLAGDLLQRLQTCYGANGIAHYAQGKWYPGEALPRWALSIYWRRDGAPLWQQRQWLADSDSKGSLTTTDASRFITEFARCLALPADHILPAWEDAFYYLWQEGQLPINLSTDGNQLEDPLARQRLREVFRRGLNQPGGYVLPLKIRSGRDGLLWETALWQFRDQRLTLVPGDSPLGLRLPLDSLEWTAPEQREQEPARDPFAQRGQLPEGARLLAASQPVSNQTATESPCYTALCCEVRNGQLHVFMPPVTELEHWLALLAAIETTAANCKLPVVLEGYPPPFDPRLEKLSVTPDPGVIEVNIQPAKDWRELVSITETIYEQARQSRLITEKFMLDGRHSGTGGGNHVTLGGPTPADSPFLRRPDLLRSLVTFWQNHPSLSYLFSGLFIGPSSQAPRVDEARSDHLHELELAFEQLPAGDSEQLWRVDRVLRNFLCDMTGNTHRAEFCIDKLYAPGSSTGRLGLVEFRNFEMPPHYQMSTLQCLLLRALVAHFWQQPLQRKLIRWGTQLHDRFMLPWFIDDDFQSVLAHLDRHGYHFAPEWFAPFFEFRFPLIGKVDVGSIKLELRTAIEPWHVLGEESSGQGTARYVDSSLERLQLRVRGLIPERHAVYCNGQALPLHSTGTHGEYIAGVRYKAWAPYSALHPTIGVHGPLVFDLVDRWNERSLGGCTYHIAHPGGRNYDTFPVNANEAEARRHARFWPHGHSQGAVPDQPATTHPEHPFTLDLRWFPSAGH